jgi:spermidine/putrescine transport system permease protein
MIKKLFKNIFLQEAYFWLTCPALLWEICFLYLPVLVLALYSILDYSSGSTAIHLTFEHYQKIFNSLYFKIILNSCVLAIVTATICLFIAYPVAYFLAFKVNKRFRIFLLFLIIIPSWTSLIVQIYAWFFLLEKNGLVSQLLSTLGLFSDSHHLLNNYFSIIVGMVSCFLPFMIFPIYAILERMDKQLLEVSADLGASRYETFKRVVFPLSLPGVYAGVLLVFIPALGEFAIPTLLGGSKRVFWGSIIVDKFLRSRDWRSGAALAIIGILFPALIGLLIYLFNKSINYFKRDKIKIDKTKKAKDNWDFTESNI